MVEYAWHDFVGNIGVVCVLGAYFGLQSRRLSVANPIYSAVNALGALLIMVSLYHDFNLSSFIIECFWLVASLYGLLNGWRRHASGD